MHKRKWFVLSLFVVLSMVLAACAGAAEETIVPTEDMEPTEMMTTEPVETEMVEPTEEMTEEATEMATEEATEPAATTAPVSGDIDCGDAQPGDEITLLYQWAGQEEERWNEIAQPLVDACGIVLRPESTRDQALLDTRVQAGNPPDIAFWNVPQLQQYQDQLQPMDELGADASSYPDFWQSIGTMNGKWVGLPVKVDIKTIIWYSPINFEAFGYEVPETWEDLEALVEQMVTDGNVPWAMGFESSDSTGWAGTDFIQDILLVTQGPEYVQGIIDGTVPYNDPGVREAWEIYGNWATDATYTVGGTEGTLSTGFVPAVLSVFGDPPAAMMVKQSGFAGGEIATQYPGLEYGTDYDFFEVPGAQGVQGGADWMMAFNDTPAVRALVQYLSSPAGGQAWAQAGFDLSPNEAGSGNYPNEQLEKRAEILANAEGFVADIGDSIPGGFGSAEFAGVVDYVNGGDLDAILDNLADIQAQNTGQ